MMNILTTALVARGRLAERSKDWESAVDLYKRAQPGLEGTKLSEVHYRLGHAAIQLEDYVTAHQALELLVGVSSQPLHWYRFGFVNQRLEQWDQAVSAFTTAIELDSQHPDWHYRLGQCHDRLGNNSEAIASVRSAIALDPSKSYYFELLIKTVRKAGHSWMLADVLEMATAAHPDNIGWKKVLAATLTTLNRTASAVDVLEAVSSGSSAGAVAHFHHGRALAELGRAKEAKKAFDEAIARDKKLAARSLGIGVFYQAEGDYERAISAYQLMLIRTPGHSELHFRIGLCFERLYEWEQAEASYELAVLLNAAESGWQYRLGLVRERLEDFIGAASAYSAAIEMHKTQNAYWKYRLGTVLAGAGLFQESCHAFGVVSDVPDSGEEILIEDRQASVHHFETMWQRRRLDEVLATQSPEISMLAGSALAKMGDWEGARIAYADACFRSNDHTEDYYRALGTAQYHLGRFEEATETFINSRILRRPHGVDATPFIRSIDGQRNIYYAEFTDTSPILDDVVLYESSAGQSVGCNPLAIYRFLSNDKRYPHLRHVWSVNSAEAVPTELLNRSNVTIIRRNSTGYLRILATAKYLINNNTFPPFFSRRDGQKYLNTWHGTPLKTLGRDIKSGNLDHKNAARNLLHATHVIVPNLHTAEALISKNDLDGIFAGKIALTGYPRVDPLTRADTAEAEALRTRLYIDPTETVVFLAPTWRGDLKNQTFDLDRMIADITKLELSGHRVFFRGHTMIENHLSHSRLSEKLVPKDVDTNDFLQITNILITDYSSILFDFLPTARQIILYAYDEDEYRTERGLYFDLEDLPVDICRTIDEVCAAVDGGTDPNHLAKTKWALESFCPMEDGEATKRTVDFLFADDLDCVMDTAEPKSSILFFQGSFIPNGISSAFRNLTSQLDPDKYRPVVVLEPGAVHGDPQRRAYYDSESHKFQTIGRVGSHLASLEERWVLGRFQKLGHHGNHRLTEIYDRAFERESHRMFGSSRFDNIVCFEGFASFWASLLAQTKTTSQRRTIMLHSDMDRERHSRFSYLTKLFDQYAKYDRLVSVSESAFVENQRNLAATYGLDPDSFNYANNLIDAETVRTRSTESPLADTASWVVAGDTTFINVARLSPEKGQAKLIEALAAARKSTGLDLRLLFVGDGPLEHQLKAQAERSGIASSVRFEGHVTNPYPLMRLADCFVFSSDYEGQGLVVLEALILGLPVISGDVVGPRSILANGEGALIENDRESFGKAMCEFATNPMAAASFDAETYNADAIERFTSVVLGERPGHKVSAP